MGNQRYKDGFGPRKRSTKRNSSRLWKKSADQARRTLQNFMVPRENRYNDANKRADDALATEKACRSPLEKSTKNNLAQPSSSRLNNGSSRLDIKKPMPSSSVPKPNLVSPRKNVGLVSPQKNKKTDKSMPSLLRPNDVRVSQQKMSGSSRLNNGKIPLHRNIDNATPSSSRPNDVLGSPQKHTNKPISSSSRPNNRSNNGSVSSQKNVKKPQPSSSTPNNGPVNPRENTKKRKPSSSRPDNGGASSSKNIEMPRPSPSRPNNDMISSPKDIETSRPSNPNGVSVSSLKNIEQFMSAKSRPSCLRCEFSSRKPTFTMPNDDSNSTFSISNKLPPSLVHNSFNVELSTQVQSVELGKAREASNSSLVLKGNQVMQGFQPQTAKASFMSNNMEQNAESISVDIQFNSRKQNSTFVNDGNADDGKSKSKMIEPLLEEKLNSHVDDDSAKENCRPKKRMRENIYENEDDVNGDQNLVGGESRTAVITENAAVKDCHTEVSHHFVSESFKLQLYSSLPIDEPIWSGIIKTCSKEYVSLAAHLSNKYCEMVSKLSRSLQPVLEVTKLSRLEAWPKCFETSRPTDDNIALYFFPDKMRQDADLDQLVKEVIENDMVLRAVVDEAEMLIFPSVLLPEQYQSFRGKPYLWGLFRPRKEKFAIVEQHGINHCAQEEMGKQQAAHRGVRKKGHMVAGLNMGVGPETPEAEGQGMEQKQTPSVAPPNTPIPVEDIARATSAPTTPAAMSANEGHGPTSAPTMPAAMSANDGQIHSSFSVPTGAMLGFVVRQTPRIEVLIEEMQREGAVVVAMRGEMIGSGLGQAVATG